MGVSVNNGHAGMSSLQFGLCICCAFVGFQLVYISMVRLYRTTCRVYTVGVAPTTHHGRLGESQGS